MVALDWRNLHAVRLTLVGRWPTNHNEKKRKPKSKLLPTIGHGSGAREDGLDQPTEGEPPIILVRVWRPTERGESGPGDWR